MVPLYPFRSVLLLLQAEYVLHGQIIIKSTKSRFNLTRFSVSRTQWLKELLESSDKTIAPATRIRQHSAQVMGPVHCHRGYKCNKIMQVPN